MYFIGHKLNIINMLDKYAKLYAVVIIVLFNLILLNISDLMILKK